MIADVRLTKEEIRLLMRMRNFCLKSTYSEHFKPECDEKNVRHLSEKLDEAILQAA